MRFDGFLSSRKRGDLLPKVSTVLEMEGKIKPFKPGYVRVMKHFTNVDPYQPVLSGSRRVFSGAEAGGGACRGIAGRRSQRLEEERWMVTFHLHPGMTFCYILDETR